MRRWAGIAVAWALCGCGTSLDLGSNDAGIPYDADCKAGVYTGTYACTPASGAILARTILDKPSPVAYGHHRSGEHCNESSCGLSIGTVVSIIEEYDFLHYLHYEPRQQALISADGHSYDRFEVEREGKSYTFYFLADRVLAAEAALFQPKP